MDLSAMIFMIVILGVIWGGFAFFLNKALSSEKQK